MNYIIVLESTVILFQVYRKKLYKTSCFLLLLGIFNTFIAPVIYYSFLNGDSYKKFANIDYYEYEIIGIIFLFFVIIFNIYRSHVNHSYLRIKKPLLIRGSANLITAFTILLTVGYMVIFRNGFPIFSILQGGGALDSLLRPDMTGALPGYFTIQTIMIGVIPCLYLYYYERYLEERKTWEKALLSAGVFLMLIAGGNKGICLYYCIFLWIFVWKAKIDWRIISAVVLCLYLYFLIMGGEISSNQSLVEYLGSPIRRFFVTQGAMFINRIAMINRGFIFDSNTISKDVFRYVYGYYGSAPTFFMGDFIINYGKVIGVILSIIILFILYYFSTSVDSKSTKGGLYIKWYYYFILYLVSMSGLDGNLIIRFVIMSVFLLFLLLDSKNYNYSTSKC